MSQNNKPDEKVIPVVQEDLVLGSRQVPRGGVRVHKQVTEHEELIDAALRKDHLEVHRVPVNREVTGPQHIRREGDTTIIPIVEEVLVVEKRLRLKEEVHITRSTVSERQRESVVLRSEEARVEHVDAEGRPRPVRRRSILDRPPPRRS